MMIVPFLDLIDTDEDKQKFSELYFQYKDLVYWVASHKINDSNLAQDVAQEVWLYIAKNFDKIQEINSGKTKVFITTLTNSRAIDKYRMEKHLVPVPLDSDVFNEEEEETYLNNIEYVELHHAIEQLDEEDRNYIRLYYYLNFTGKEIAEMLDKTPAYVRKRLQIIRGRLRAILEGGVDNDKS